MPSIQTHSRAMVSLDLPDAVEIRDVAHALSLICRFNGHTPTSYSVAQHSLAVSFEAGRLAVKANCPDAEIREVKLLGLLHDAHEYLCGDVTRPLKEVLGEVWKNYESRLQKAVLAGLGIVVGEIPQHIRDLVKLADDRLLEAERFVFFGVAPSEKHQDVSAYSINPWSVTWARSKFLKVYEELTGAA